MSAGPDKVHQRLYHHLRPKAISFLGQLFNKFRDWASISKAGGTLISGPKEWHGPPSDGQLQPNLLDLNNEKVKKNILKMVSTKAPSNLANYLSSSLMICDGVIENQTFVLAEDVMILAQGSKLHVAEKCLP